MYLPTLFALSSVLLASNASLFSSADSNTTFKGFSFAAKATAGSADKGSSDNHTLLNEANMEVRRLTFHGPAHVTLCTQSTPER